MTSGSTGILHGYTAKFPINPKRKVPAMEWTAERKRGAGLIADTVRDRWAHAVLLTLAAAPQRPGSLFDTFQRHDPVNAALFGPHAMYREHISRILSDLTRAGLSDRGDGHVYRLTELAAGMLASLGATAEYSAAHFEFLVRGCRTIGRLDTDAPMPAETDDGPEARTARLGRRAQVALFGILLEPAWSMQVLTELADGPLRAAELLTRINAVVEANRDVAGPASLSRGALYRRIEGMRGTGLVACAGSGGTGFGLTGFSVGLLESMGPIAAFGIARDAGLADAARVRRGDGVRSTS